MISKRQGCIPSHYFLNINKLCMNISFYVYRLFRPWLWVFFKINISYVVAEIVSVVKDFHCVLHYSWKNAHVWWQNLTRLDDKLARAACRSRTGMETNALIISVDYKQTKKKHIFLCRILVCHVEMNSLLHPVQLWHIKS